MNWILVPKRDRRHYDGFIRWLNENAGHYEFDEKDGYQYIKISDPKLETLAVLRWQLY
ncbi:MAG: hypothetical protein ABFD07_16620 [Methanobacterium sp.]